MTVERGDVCRREKNQVRLAMCLPLGKAWLSEFLELEASDPGSFNCDGVMGTQCQRGTDYTQW